MFGQVPQIFKMYKTKSVEDVSLPSYMQIFLGIFLWTIYSLHIQDIPMIISNAVTLLSTTTVILLYLKYKKVK
jgi:MtN3 and saliva related transmembrane protein